MMKDRFKGHWNESKPPLRWKDVRQILPFYALLFTVFPLTVQLGALRELPPTDQLPAFRGEVIRVEDISRRSKSSRDLSRLRVLVKVEYGLRNAEFGRCDDASFGARVGQQLNAIEHRGFIVGLSIDGRECQSIAKYRAKLDQARAEAPGWIAFQLILLLIALPFAFLVIRKWVREFTATDDMPFGKDRSTK